MSAAGRQQQAEMCQVEVQIVANTVWQGRLPESFAFDSLRARWALASEVMQLPAAARVYTGPFPLQEDFTIARAEADGIRLFRRRATGALVLTVQPEIQGGGTKDEVLRAVKSQLGHLCLSQGCSLADVSVAIDRLVEKAGLARLQAVLRVANAPDQWRDLQGLFLAQQVPVPVVDSAAQQAARKIQAAARRKKFFQQTICATDFSLISGFIADSSGQPAPILQATVPGAKGVILLDHEPAKLVLQDVSAQHFDMLGVLVLGTDCPCASSCNGRLSFPAFSKTGEGQVLLSGCFHSVGRTALQPALKSVPDVVVSEAVHCSFQMYLDEWTGDGQWTSITKNPVRHACQVKQSGMDQVLAQPWARSFKKGQSPATPTTCDMILFSAKVDRSKPSELLQASGHNSVYVTPRDWGGKIMEGWAVVWTTAERSEATRLAMTVKHQAGLIRSKSRFGIRVASEHFEAVFRQIRPAQDVSEQVAVHHLYKLSPLPPGADAASITAWGRGLSWRIKVLKALGPQCLPPEGFLTFNGVSILVLPVPQRTAALRVIQAGHRSLGSAAPSRPNTLPPLAIGDPWDKEDPWKDYLSKVLQKAPARATAAASSVSLQQDQRLSALESSLAEMKQNQQDHVVQCKRDKQALEHEMSQLTRQFATSFDALQRSQTLQQEQMNQGIAELKALMTGRESTDHSKKPRVEKPKPMEWEPDDKL